MRIKIRIDTDDTADLLALKAMVELYLSQPAQEPRTSQELMGLMQERVDHIGELMARNMQRKLYGDDEPTGCVCHAPLLPDEVPSDTPLNEGSLTREWDRYR